jgi:hypothetical protein
MGATSVDVGKSGDKIEVVIPAFLKKVDSRRQRHLVQHVAESVQSQ